MKVRVREIGDVLEIEIVRDTQLEAANRELLEVEVEEPDPPRAVAVGPPVDFTQFLAMFH